MKVLVERDEYGSVDVFTLKNMGKVIERILAEAPYIEMDSTEKVTKRKAMAELKKNQMLSFYEEDSNITRYDLDICEVKS
jgi:hypothetical protein